MIRYEMTHDVTGIKDVNQATVRRGLDSRIRPGTLAEYDKNLYNDDS
jgi:hypothetical protein